MHNLESTKDSYSDNEDIVRKKRLAFGAESAAEIYASCKKLLFKVDLIIKNSRGEIVLQRKLDTLSEVFSAENRPIVTQVCQDL